MDLILDYSMAWLATFAMLAVILKRITRAARSRWKGSRVLVEVDTALHHLHKPAGLVVVIAGLVHGLTSSDRLLSINPGTVSLALALLMGVLYMLRKRVKPAGGWMNTHRMLALAAAIVLVLHIVDVGGIRIFDIWSEAFSRPVVAQTAAAAVPDEHPSVTEPESSQTSGTTQETANGLLFDGCALADGTYAGSADGYGPSLAVEVIVSGGQVASVVITGHNEIGIRFYTRPMDRLPGDIVDAQSIGIDTVSGATMTSVGILNAVRDALEEAVVSGTLPEALELPRRMMR